MLKKLKNLEKLSAGLDPSADQRGEMTKQTLDYAESFLDRLPDINTFEADLGCSKALEQPFTFGLGVAFLYILVSYQVMALLFPEILVE